MTEELNPVSGKAIKQIKEMLNKIDHLEQQKKARPSMKIEIAKFQDGYYYVVDGVKQHKVNETEVYNMKIEIPEMVLKPENIIASNFGLGAINPVPHVGSDGKAYNLAGEKLLQSRRNLLFKIS